MNDIELTRREKELKEYAQELIRKEKELDKRERELSGRERSAKFWKKMFLLFFMLNAAHLAFILYTGWPAFENMAHHGEPKEPVQTASNEEKQASEILASVEGDIRLGKFTRANAWEAIDFAANEAAMTSDYHGRRLFPVKNGTLLVNSGQIKEGIRSVAQTDTVRISKDRKEFRFDLQDSKTWESLEIIRKKCLSLEQLSPGTGSYTYDNVKRELSYILAEAEKKQGDRYGYVRFFFKTSLEGVSIMRAYSLDVTKRPADYFVIESGSQYKAADGFPEKVDRQSKYDGTFRTMSFSFLRDAPASVMETLDSCLDEFFSQLLRGKE